MVMFTNCSGKCSVCIRHFTACLAGHGDDDYERITEDAAKELLEKEGYSEKLKSELLSLFPKLKIK